MKLLSFLVASSISVSALADNYSKTYPFNIPSQRADASLIQFAQQADLTLLFPQEATLDKQANPLIGEYSIEQGLQILLNHTGLKGELSASGQLAIYLETKVESSDMVTQHNKNKLSSAVLAILTGMAFGQSANAAEDEQTTQATDDVAEVIQVKGFRGALFKSLEEKRNAVNVTESIMSEDMGKFPDLNIAEAIQRVPGVAISREGGEGRQITLRGLGPSFTRATLNGMEVPASTDGLDSGNGINNGRSFDFNVFASELFNRVDIQKSTTASMEEGGIAGTVDLYSAKPFDYAGFKVAASAQGGYNSLTSETDPRLAFMISNTFADNTFGALFSVAYSERTVRQEGFGTVRYTTPVEAGQLFPDTDNTVVNGEFASEACEFDGAQVDPLNCLWLPRLPRADFFGNNQTRLGVTGSLQYRPTENATLTLDLLHSKLENKRTGYNSMEWFLTPGTVTPLEVSIDPNGKQIMAATFDNVESWIESREQNSDTDFSQYVLSGQFNLTDTIKLDTMIGHASSDAAREEFRYYYVSQPHIYSFDFSNSKNIPEISYGEGYDYYDAANYEVRPATIRSNDVNRKNLTAKADLTIELDDMQIKTGVAYNDREVEYVVGDGFYGDAVSAVGYTKDFPYSDFGDGLDQALMTFPVADFAALERDGILSREFTTNLSSSWTVIEETVAAYAEANGFYDVGDMLLRTNFGVRYVETTTTSKSHFNGNPVEEENSYNNFLPSLNLALEVTDDFITRFSAGRSMTRASLNALNIANPNFTYETRTVSIGNPKLKPYESNDYDLGFEWYFADEALLSATYFYKDIVTASETLPVDKLIDPVYYDTIYADPRYDESYDSDPATVEYTHYTPVNVDGEAVKGIELIYQQPFSFLNGWMSNFGIVTNYTRVSTDDMTGMSENSYNFTVYYEEETYGARISANMRDDYLLSKPGGNGHVEEMKYGPTHIDFSSFYNFNENLTFTFEIINLTDEKERIYGTGYGDLDLTREYNHTGTYFFVGARYTL
ncbi:TonB-dependent receptor [Catenovulum sp. 2E275]|uniref:TonB-dependent receptor n=1 Tax=Catenovulum sp. 2E275 TaxID=2980497 RepID=UPI0021D1D5BA|nr:TonB-dependent receptor [Catenovulum sp. 2E275]MCU4677260.1 TonB-dependent receptor [Catenovulum sp. 2E275]